ncbi:protein VAC14 homolog [Condylostylus longicornis]|uniref:protein VAC14 homolog n=1 Tax=Condylostylus longicornis TaxID=2530218 RepID=UPI00244E1D48|nr:protein VAC14 homolog [Condylostylus longicornis]XP_055376103.1 protein VAC14 homolog [Condylostylus longicornis]
MDSPYYPLSESCAKALGDKMYDKRKLAAGEIEKTVVELNNKKNVNQIKKLIEVLANNFATSRDPNRRKGGLIGLAATSLGLGKDSEKYINELVPPIITCLADADLRVRYFACESLYNVVKVARTAIIPLFPDIFQALLRLVTDPDQAVKDGSELLDRLLKDIVTESSSLFNLNQFIPLLRERVYIKSSFGRQYVISWISVLNAVPEINMVTYLTDILDGLFLMLEDSMIEIHRMCETLLAQFLKSIRQDPSSVKIKEILICLIGHAQSTNELIQSTAINWIKEFISIFGPEMIPYYSGIFTAILPCLAYEGESKKNIRDCALAVNKSMLELLSTRESKKENIKKIDLGSVMEVLRQYLTHNSVHTKVAVLKWIHHLLTEIQSEMCSHATHLFPVLLNILSDSSDEVVLQGLTVLAEIVNSTHINESGDFNKTHYRKFLLSLSNLFHSEKQFLENRGSLIIRQLCVHLNAEYIYRTFAEIIAEEKTNIKFASTMVRSLNMILLTSSELFDLRQSLRDIRNSNSASLFKCLYKSWAHCPISVLSLGLLAQSYQHVSDLVVLFGKIEITVEFLTELDKLVQLIESPIFASLRLVLVSKSNQCADAQHLAHALFGILMLMPQTDAFMSLKNRLQCVPNYWGQSPLKDELSIQSQSQIDFDELLQHFQKIQQMHREQRITSRKRSVLLWDSEVNKE